MSLKVWLSGDYKNRGSADVSVTNNGTTLDSDRNSYVFNGNNSYINLGKIESLFDATPFSITFWIYSNENGTRGIIFGAYGITSTSSFLNIEINNSSSTNNYLRFDWKGPDKGFGSVFIPYQQWSHIAITYDGVSSLKVYQNGVLKQTVTTTLETIGNNSDYYVGKDSRNGTTAFDGKLADFRIYDEAISPELIRHLSRQPHEKELRVWLPLNGDLRNQGTADVTVTNNGATVDNSGKMGKCYYLNGNKLSFTNPKVGNWNKFTVCGWVKLADGYTANNGLHLFIFGATYYRICISKDNRAVRVLLSDGTTNHGGSSNMSASALSAAIWNHYAVSFDNGKVSIYINGVLDNSYTVSFTSVQFVNATLNIGTYSSETCKGSINDFRLYSYALSPEEIKKISQGLALHYRLSGIGGENEFLGTADDDWWTKCTCHNIGGASYEIIQDDYLSGFQILKITRQNNTNQSGVYTYPTRNRMINGEMAQDETYTLSFMMKASTSGVETIPNIIAEAQTMVSCSHGLSWTEIPTKWTKYWITFTVKNPKQAICFYMRGTASAIVYFGKIKLEKGSKATPWLPNTTDSLYSTMGLDNYIEYDISGFNNNGIRNNIEIDIDSPRYMTCYKFNPSNSSYVRTTDNNWISTDATEYTVNIWAYMDNWGSYGARIVSCTESGGFNTELYNKSISFPIYVWNNENRTSGAYTAAEYRPLIPVASLSSGWHMFTFIYSLTTISSYVDGELFDEKEYTSYGTYFRPNISLVIGAEPTGNFGIAGSYYNGKLSDFRLYYTALSASDVQALYNLGEVQYGN